MKLANETKYSKELIERFQKYFKEKYGVDVDEEKANEWLDALADFYITLATPG
jgi:hypothetical protein